MLHIFRRIRQKFLSENRLSKYFIYAIGEIILVVVGILIALQINNANENRKARLQEITILQNIKEDISLDTLDISYNLDGYNRMIKAEIQLLNFLKSTLRLLMGCFLLAMTNRKMKIITIQIF